MRNVVLTAASLLLLSGCVTRMTDFTVISTKNVQVPSSSAQRVEAEDCVPVVLFPFGIPNLKTAIDRAIEKAGPQYDALIDGVVYSKNYSFLIGKICYTVEGTPISTRKAPVSALEGKEVLRHS